MKKSILVLFTMLTIIMFGSVVLAAPKSAPLPAQPPTPLQNGSTINACMKKVNGQLRIVSAATTCLPSETAIFWNTVGAQGPQGPSGVVSTLTISGEVGVVPGNSTVWVFAGPTVNVTLTATERVTGAVQSPLGTTLEGTALFNYDLCYRAAGTVEAPVNFAGAGASGGAVTGPQIVPFPAIASAVPGNGAWEVGYCLLNSGASDLDNNGFANGWIIVTE